MKKFVYFIIVLIAFVLVQSNYAETKDNDIVLTEKQKEFQQDVQSIGDYFKAEWINSLTFELIYNPVTYGYLTKDEAEEKAVSLAAYGYTYTLKDICVKITDPKKGELAYYCVGKNIPSKS